jgi:hypothetical protein
MVLVVRQGAVGLGTFPLRNSQLVAEIDGGDAKEFVVAFDAAFDIGFQIICCGDSARFQRAGKCAGQSTSERGDDMVDGGGKRRGVFHAVIFGVAAMHAKMKRLRESLDVRVTERPFLLDQTDFGCVNNFTHECPLPTRYFKNEKVTGETAAAICRIESAKRRRGLAVCRGLSGK